MIIREARDSDLEDVLSVERAAFDSNIEAELARKLLEDNSAKPSLSLLAFKEERPVGHILFTKALLEPEASLTISLLAPMAVVPDAQKQGIGSELIKQGLALLTQAGVDLVFVLGYPTYYSRHGFKPAGALGFEATYPLPEKNADAWMVQELRPGVLGSAQGKIICANVMNKPEYWRE